MCSQIPSIDCNRGLVHGYSWVQDNSREMNSALRESSLKSWFSARQQVGRHGQVGCISFSLLLCLMLTLSVLSSLSSWKHSQSSRLPSPPSLASDDLQKVKAPLINLCKSSKAYLSLNTLSSREGTCEGFIFIYLSWCGRGGLWGPKGGVAAPVGLLGQTDPPQPRRPHSRCEINTQHSVDASP